MTIANPTLGIPHAGLPPLDLDGPAFSRFELMNPLLFYAPVLGYALTLMLRHRSITLPTIANPKIFAGGVVGEHKSQVMDLAGSEAQKWIAPYVAFPVCGASDERLQQAHNQLKSKGIDFPFVAKPDSGLRGAGVQMIKDEAALQSYLDKFPENHSLVLQALVPFEAEAGIFYVRKPGAQKGEIFSITLKYAPYIFGDGKSTLKELILADERAAEISDIYLERHKAELQRVLSPGEAFKLVFAGNHCKGAIFRNGTHLVTDAMLDRFDAISRDVDEFYFGRFDIRFHSVETLQRGEDFQIVEINGTGSEATHIWDRSMTLKEAYRTLFKQWRIAYEIGAENRKRGFKTTGLFEIFRAWKAELDRGANYPTTM
ncbi:MAG: ATP-grasp domain-containing protein [Sphingomonadales bacterium]